MDATEIRLKLVEQFSYHLDDGRRPKAIAGEPELEKTGWTVDEFITALSKIEKYVAGA